MLMQEGTRVHRTCSFDSTAAQGEERDAEKARTAVARTSMSRSRYRKMAMVKQKMEGSKMGNRTCQVLCGASLDFSHLAVSAVRDAGS